MTTAVTPCTPLPAGTPPTGRPAGPVLPRPLSRAGRSGGRTVPEGAMGGRGTRTWRVRPADGPAAAESPDRSRTGRTTPGQLRTTPDNSRRCTHAVSRAGRGIAPAGRSRPPHATSKAPPAGADRTGQQPVHCGGPGAPGARELVAPLAGTCSTLQPLRAAPGSAAHPAGRLGVRKQRCSRAAVRPLHEAPGSSG